MYAARLRSSKACRRASFRFPVIRCNDTIVQSGALGDLRVFLAQVGFYFLPWCLFNISSVIFELVPNVHNNRQLFHIPIISDVPVGRLIRETFLQLFNLLSKTSTAHPLLLPVYMPVLYMVNLPLLNKDCNLRVELN